MWRIPASGTWSDYITPGGMEVLKMDFPANIDLLWKGIFNKDYK